MALKKIIFQSAALVLAAAMISGCSRKDNHGLDPDNPATVTVWHYYNGVQQENFDKLVAEFNETVGYEQGIIIKASSKSNISDLADSALASLRQEEGAEPAPNMFAAYAETAFTADQMGCLVDMSQYFSSEELSEYVEGYLAEGDLNNKGELKIFPTAKSTEVMLINATDWQTFADAAGVTKDSLSTWEGLADTAEKYYNYTDGLTPDIPGDGKALFGRDSVANYMIVGAKQLGLEYFTSEGGSFTMNENKEAVRRLWDAYYVPYVKGCYLSQGRFRSDDAKTGSIISMVCSTTGAAYFPKSVTPDDEHSYSIECLVLPVPYFEGTDRYVVQQGAGMVVVKSDETTEYACSVFLKWFTDKERNTYFSAGSGYLPVKKDANDTAAISASYTSSGGSADDPLLIALSGAVDEINSSVPYAAKPFERSAETRDFLETYIQDTAQKAHDDAYARIGSGEDRASVMNEYTSDSAFEAWYSEFISGLKAAAGI
ncbi:MAG: extracellular solute-binding protein [Oscillospiraceae bacterium]|nr:extracellular solute-binding protein [Oscillospiraceae bacterium]